MSGGVDSSTVAHLLKEQGHDLVGVRMNLWTDPLAPAAAQLLPSKCCDVQTVARAQQVANNLGIEYHTIDLQDEFKQEVVDTFIDQYRSGLTPNPCVHCNKVIKFGLLHEIAEKFGCEKVATGHYARIEEESQTDGSQHYHLLEAVDNTKNQAYFLYRLDQEQLAHSLFPLGDKKKKDVLTLAKEYGIPLPDQYEESQDVCFYPERKPRAFLERHICDASPGDIVLEDDTKVGEHRGIPFYTIGQRRGLNVGGLKIPLHVVKKDAKNNTIVVAPDGEDFRSSLTASDINWICTEPDKDTELVFEARINSNGGRKSCSIVWNGSDIHCTFSEPIRGIAPGQSLVLYEEEELVGGGIIA